MVSQASDVTAAQKEINIINEKTDESSQDNLSNHRQETLSVIMEPQIIKKPVRINSSTGNNSSNNGAMIRNISEKRDKIDKIINNRVVRVQQPLIID